MVRNGFRTMRDTRGTMYVPAASVGVEAAGGGGSGNMSRYRAGNWWLRCGRPDEGRSKGRGAGREVEGDSNSASGVLTSACPELVGYNK
jgi:hypothetical protein